MRWVIIPARLILRHRDPPLNAFDRSRDAIVTYGSIVEFFNIWLKLKQLRLYFHQRPD